MLPFPLPALNEATLNSVCVERISESDTLDFKAELTGKDDRGKAELAKDVSAMANADGGDLVFGIKEDKDGGAAESISPITGESFDEAHRRIRSTLDAWLEPKVLGLQVQEVKVSGGYVIVVRIPKSFSGPHCVRHGVQRRFTFRNGTQASDMSFDQIRTAFDRTATIGDRARKIIADRIDKISLKRTPRPMEDVPLAVVECVPLASVTGRASVDIQEIFMTSYHSYAPPVWSRGSISRDIGLDGVTVYTAGREKTGGIATVFRDARCEQIMNAGWERDGNKIIGSSTAKDFLRQAVGASISVCRKHGIAGPAILQYAMVNVSNYRFGVGHDFDMYGSGKADRNDLILPEIWIDDVADTSVNVNALLAPTLDVLWQCFGFEKALDAT